MGKEELLNDLRSETYVMLKPSGVHGIGVFAVRDIPKGCRNIFSKNFGEWLKISRQEIETLPTHSISLIENFCLYDDLNYFIPDYGFKVMDLVCYLNHSDTPNIISINDGEVFEAIEEIKEGEELLIDYGQITGDE